MLSAGITCLAFVWRCQFHFLKRETSEVVVRGPGRSGIQVFGINTFEGRLKTFSLHPRWPASPLSQRSLWVRMSAISLRALFRSPQTYVFFASSSCDHTNADAPHFQGHYDWEVGVDANMRPEGHSGVSNIIKRVCLS